MTPQDRIDTGFAPWSLMTPDPAKARATSGHVQTAKAVHEDKRAPEMAADDGYMFGEDGLTFGDVLDIVNPLQHLPVVGAVYRSITGDEMEPGAKMAGGALFGGPIGFASAMVNNAIEEHTGDDVMGHMLAMVGLGGDGAGDGIADGTAVAQAPISDASAGLPATAMQASGSQIAGPLVAPGTFPAGAEAQLAADAINAVNAGTAMQLDSKQAAFLERLAARGAGNGGPDAESEPLDALLTGAPAAAANANANRRADYAGVARVSNEMAKHLSMLAQTGAPNQALPQMPQPLQPAAGQSRAPSPADMRAASAKYSAALPVSIDGSAPAANPFAAIQARQNQPDPFETAMNRLGLNPPTMTGRGGENTESKLMEAAFGKGQSQTATLADAAGITAPPGEVPSAMLDALQRYQAMKQQG